jgi:hypothetical protein
VALSPSGVAAVVVVSVYPFLSFSAINLSCDYLASAAVANSLRCV